MDCEEQLSTKKRDVPEQATDITMITTNHAVTTLPQLNDYCFLKIFSMESLVMADLCSLADTCERFKYITTLIMPKEMNIGRNSSGEYTVHSRHYRHVTGSQREVARIFINFASSLSEISHSNCSRKEYFVLNLIARYCDENLVILRLTNLRIHHGLTVDLNPIFRRLRVLDLADVFVGDGSLFAGLNSLVELDVMWVENCGVILQNIFPNLERFKFVKGKIVPTGSPHCSRTDQTVDALSTFISRHKTIKALKISFDCDANCKVIILQAIVASCSDLEQLTINLMRTTVTVIQPLQALKSLKCLKLWNMTCDALDFFPQLTNLRELHLIACNLPEVPEDAKQYEFLAQLTKLTVSGTPCLNSHNHFVGMVRGLVNLEELTIPWLLHEETFAKITEIVAGRRNVLTLKCEYNFDYLTNGDDNRKVRLLSLD